MAGIASVRFTQLFWDTLEERRGLAEYRAVREAIADLILRKSDSLAPVNGRDKPFKGTVLRGIWHTALHRKTDIVLIYEPRGTELVLGMLGTHHSYPSEGKNKSVERPLAARIASAAAGPHVPAPGWDAPRWRRPADLTRHPDLADVSPRALGDLQDALRAELDTGAAYRRLRGRDLLETDGDELTAWLEETQEALDAVSGALRAAPMDGEEYVRHLREMSGPSR